MEIYKYRSIDANISKNLKDGVKDKFLSDYRDTHDILSNVDAVISPLSTILIEAAIHGKPSLCFLPYSDKSLHFKIDNELIHFQEFFQKEKFLKAYGYDDFLPRINDLIQLTNIPNINHEMKKEASFFVKSFDKSYSIRLNNFIENLIINNS